MIKVCILCAFALVGQSESSSENRVELVDPKPYAIKRFAEIVQDYQKNQPPLLRDRLIRAKAMMRVAEKRQEQIETSEESSKALQNQLKALEAMIDHYQKQIQSLEKRIKATNK